jgi:hypothetical protein
LLNDLSKEFRIAIAKAGGQKAIAFKMGISESELSRKLSGERGWKTSELQQLFEIAEMYLANGGKEMTDFDLIMEMSRKLSETMKAMKEMGTKEGE